MLKLFFHIFILFININQKFGIKLKILKFINNIVKKIGFLKKSPVLFIENTIINKTYYFFLLKLNYSSKVTYKSIRFFYLNSILHCIRLIVKLSLKLINISFQKKITNTIINVGSYSNRNLLDVNQSLKNILNFESKKTIIKGNKNNIKYKCIKFKNKYFFL